MEHYIASRDVGLMFFHWIGIELLKAFKMPYEPNVGGDHTLTFNEFTTLASCNNQCCKASHIHVF
jgi:hypothetical protein